MGKTKGSEDLLAGQFRHQAGKVSRQATVFLLGTVFTVSIGYLFKIYVSRVLGAEGLGLYALGNNAVELFALFAALGLPRAMARYVAVYRGTGQEAKIRGLVIRSSLILLANTAILGLLLFWSRHWFANRVFKEPELAQYLPIFALILPLATGNTFLGQYLRGHQEVTRRTVINHFVQLPTKIVLTVALFALGWGLSGYVAAQVGGLLLASLLLAKTAVRLTPSRRELASHELAKGESSSFLGAPIEREVFSYAGSMVGFRVLNFFNGRADVFILGILLTADQVGIYSIAVATGAFIPVLLTALNSIFGPIIADLHARKEQELLLRLFQTSTKWCMGLTFPLVMVVVFFAPELMGLFGAEFKAGSVALALVALGQFVNVAAGSVGNLLIMSGHQRLELIASAASALLTLALQLLLIPIWGIVGGAAALALGLSCTNLVRILLVRHYLGLWAYSRRFLRLVPPLAASTFVTWWLWSSSFLAELPGMVTLVIAGLATYAVFVGCALVFALDSDDEIILTAVKAKLQAFLPRRA